MKAYLTEPIYDYKGVYAVFSLSRIEGKLYWRHLRYRVTSQLKDLSDYIKLDRDVLQRECKKTNYDILIPFREEDLQ